MKRLLLLVIAVTVLGSCSHAEIEVRSKGMVLPDNTVVHYLEAGQGPLLVLVHGLGGSAEMWRDSLRLLARGYRVIALDLPGFGKSDKPHVEYSVPYYSRVLAEFIAALGPGKAALAGNSLGGWIAALTTLEHPGRVSYLILVDSSGLRRESPSPVNLNPATREEQKALLRALFANPSLVTEKLVSEQWEYRREIRTTAQSVLASLTAGPPFLDGRLKAIAVPTLVIWGRQDALIPSETAARFSKAIPGSKLVMIEAAGHLPMVEQPAAFYRAIKGFVKTW